MSSSLTISKDFSCHKIRVSSTCLLKSKENIFKSTCSKALKKKLKKYKLRKDGQEDPDVIDVSKILVSTLRIKSPNYKETNILSTEKSNINTNYLFKMVKNKNATVDSNANNQVKRITNIEDEIESSPLLQIHNNEINETKQLDAFKMMMDSRNKSIGSNSPGKMIIIENHESESTEKREIKAKRNLYLFKMAEKKGSLINQEDEDFRDRWIKRKLDKRADRLKSMIKSTNCKMKNKITQKSNEVQETFVHNSNNKEEKMKSTLQLFNFLSEADIPLGEHNKNKNLLSQEDDDFLKKLSPSIRKRENMLSYFKKIPKDSSEQSNLYNTNDDQEIESTIKVKFPAQNKKRSMKAKNHDENIHIANEKSNTQILSNNSISTRKRKRDKAMILHNDKKLDVTESEHSNGRPKRNIKKPTKYQQDSLSSSDEELHIFTPRKKKITDKIVNVTNGEDNKKQKKKKKSDSKYSMSKVSKCIEPKISKKSIENPENQKALKLAPIFSAKPKLTPVEQKAKEQFLKSGVPDKLKIKHLQQDKIIQWNYFHSVVHIQQKLNTEPDSSACNNEELKFQPLDWYKWTNTQSDDTFYDNDDGFFFKILLTDTYVENSNKCYKIYKPQQLINFIKKSYSRFPVYRTYHLLKIKNDLPLKESNSSELDNSAEIVEDIIDINNDSPEKLTWNDKYKPMESKQIIGNFENVKEIKKWLESWNETLKKNKNNVNEDSDLSDFIFSDSETDSTDAYKNNVLIISGQSGIGKTSCVYAVAAELAIKVLEINASSKRTGKIMLQDLQEATQSHKVNRGHNKVESSQSRTDKIVSKIVKKHGRPRKTYERFPKKKKVINNEVLSQQSQTSSQENTRTGMSLILIDDADIVFDQDDGFCSAVSQLLHFSKRPVILITSSLTCPHLQKFINCGKVIQMQPLLPKMLGTWLDIMCLVDTNICYPGLGGKVLDYFIGDIRKSINYLQFYITSNKYLNQTEDASQSTDSNINNDDENSSMSWAEPDLESVNDNTSVIQVDDCELKTIVEKQLMILNSDISLFNFWWNISYELSPEKINISSNEVQDNSNIDIVSRNLDIVSFIDCFENNNVNSTYNITSRPWSSFEVPSVTEKENLDLYNVTNELNKDLSKDLLTRLSTLNKWKKSPNCIPGLSTQRERNKIVSRHNVLSTYLNQSTALDRRALALDYWSACRTICRIEKCKTDNVKRNNRFCHYLKSLNILCKNDYFDSLCESLNEKKTL